MTRTLKDFKCLRPPVFKGSIDPIIVDSWLTEIIRLLDVLNLEEKKWVALATYQLEGKAVLWWEHALRYRDTNIGRIKWKKFEEIFMDKYFPKSVRDGMEAKFLELIYGLKLVGEYEVKFTKLSRYAPHLVATKTSRAKRFIQELNPSIRELLVSYLICNYGKACQCTLALEHVLLENIKLQEKRSSSDVEKKPEQEEKRVGKKKIGIKLCVIAVGRKIICDGSAL